MGKIILKVVHSINIEDIKDLLDSAGRGAEYWSINQLGYESEVNDLCNGGFSNVFDCETRKDIKLTLKKIEKGLRIMAVKYPIDFAGFIESNYDRDTGDTFLQCCLFGEVIYG